MQKYKLRILKLTISWCMIVLIWRDSLCCLWVSGFQAYKAVSPGLTAFSFLHQFFHHFPCVYKQSEALKYGRKKPIDLQNLTQELPRCRVTNKKEQLIWKHIDKIWRWVSRDQVIEVAFLNFLKSVMHLSFCILLEKLPPYGQLFIAPAQQ